MHEWKYLAIAVTEITMSADRGVRLLTNIIIPQKGSIQIGTQ